MLASELFKLRNHRTPWVLLSLYCTITLIAPIWLALRPPADRTAYLSASIDVFANIGLLFGAVYGGWVMGHEYRQGTLRRVLAIDDRRSRLLAVKAGVGAAVLTIGLVVAAGVAIAAAATAAALNGDTIVFDGVLRSLGGAAFPIVVTALIAFLLSVITRSDTYAIIGTLGVTIIVGPLLGLIPTIGKYTLFASTTAIADAISAPEASETVISGVFALTATLAATGYVAVLLFGHRDV